MKKLFKETEKLIKNQTEIITGVSMIDYEESHMERDKLAV